jgi:hypothetical protein
MARPKFSLHRDTLESDTRLTGNVTLKNVMQLTDDVKRGLIATLLSSSSIRYPPRYHRILECLFHSNFKNSATSLSDLAEICFSDYHHEPDEAVSLALRSAVRSLRKALTEYFQGEGRLLPYRVQVSKEPPFTLLFEENLPKPEDYTALFWAPYLGGAKNLMLISEPQFFWRSDQRVYTRDIFHDEVLDSRRPDGGTELDPSFHYISAGETIAAITLLRRFEALQATLDFGIASTQPYELPRDCNLIVIGSSRTNQLLRRLQDNDIFTLTESGVRVRGEQTDRYLDEVTTRHGTKHPSQVALTYAILTRKPGSHPDSVITMIAANHGRAVQGVVDFITNRSNLQTFFEGKDIRSIGSTTTQFQIVFRVTVSDAEMTPDTLVPIAWRSADTTGERQDGERIPPLQDDALAGEVTFNPEAHPELGQPIGLLLPPTTSAGEAVEHRERLLARYHELVDRKFSQRLNRRDALELRGLQRELNSDEDPKLLLELGASLRTDRELLRRSIDEILLFSKQLKVK